MKISNIPAVSSTQTGQRSERWGRVWSAIRVGLAGLGWGIFILAVMLVGYVVGWAGLAAVLLGRGPTEEVPVALLVALALGGASGWLVTRVSAPARSLLRVAGVILAVELAAWAAWAVILPDEALFLARQVAWGESAQSDYQLFPERVVNNSGAVFEFKQSPAPELFEEITYRSEGQTKQASFDEFLDETQTAAFIVIKDDAILYEGYANGYERDSIVTSFSVAKSFTSALVGIAIDEGYIGSVNDPFTEYIPELKGKGFDAITIRHLLTMSSGIDYTTDDELPALKEITQFTDSGLTYSHPDLRKVALQIRPDGEAAGARFNYNNYCPLLLGMILERTTGRPVAEYLQEKIWQPLGMAFPGSWSLDSEKSGFELMGSGINGRAIDFAKFGRLFLNDGNWDGVQVISEGWVRESTSPDPNDRRTWRSEADWQAANGYYKYMWWGKFRPNGGYDFTALGHLGQFIYVAPQERVIVVRFGREDGGVDSWPDILRSVVDRVSGTPQASSPAVQGWRSSTPEEMGFDSEKIAAGLQAIQQNGTRIHSLMIVQDGAVVLDAYFYPYDGTIYHDLASVTKSVMTTLIGIAADQGKLDLDQPVLSFFPERTIANRDPRKERMTVRHLASMTSGLSCTPEDNERTLREMWASPDWVQFVLDRKMMAEPGKRFIYCSPGMHLLSAVLQKATGMTALEFARENLFAPLGIQEVYWPADGQSVTHGWGDLCLRPADMARLGLLFLNQGSWEGRQVVSRQWVQEATRKQSATGGSRGEDYGYGWWIGRAHKEAEFLAAGNGGQKIKVYPNLKLMIVTTGGGFEYDEIEPYLLPAILDRGKAWPANPEGQKQLAAVLAGLVEPPAAEPAPALPAIAGEVSGQTYRFEANELGLRVMRLDFNNPSEATLRLEMANEASPRLAGVGLDGRFRPSQQGPPTMARGQWTAQNTFVIEYNEGPGFAVFTIKIVFEGERLVLELQGTGLKMTVGAERSGD